MYLCMALTLWALYHMKKSNTDLDYIDYIWTIDNM